VVGDAGSNPVEEEGAGALDFQRRGRARLEDDAKYNTMEQGVVGRGLGRDKVAVVNEDDGRALLRALAKRKARVVIRRALVL
jgi:hypothetical protein